MTMYASVCMYVCMYVQYVHVRTYAFKLINGVQKDRQLNL